MSLVRLSQSLLLLGLSACFCVHHCMICHSHCHFIMVCVCGEWCDWRRRLKWPTELTAVHICIS